MIKHFPNTPQIWPSYEATSTHEPRSRRFYTRAAAEFWLWAVAERVEGQRNRFSHHTNGEPQS